MNRHRGWAVTLAVVVLLVLSGLAGFTGCGGEAEMTTTTAAASRPTATTAGPATTVAWSSDGDESSEAAPSYAGSSGGFGPGVAIAGTLTALEAASGQKIIGDAQLEIEVEAGKFQAVFSQALNLAARYGGYLVSSSSYASGEENAMKSGTVVIRVPSTSFAQALSDAAQLGTLKNEQLSTQDVTEEYVDLEARIKNTEAELNQFLGLLGKADTIDEILKVQSYVTNAQQELEQLRGRLRYLDEHTSYSTVTMNIYETGTEPVVASTWGTGSAFKDALHYLVRVFNGVVRGLGVLIPVLIVMAIIGYIVYRIVLAVQQRNQRQMEARYPSRPQGWRAGPDAMGMGAGPGANAGPGATAGPGVVAGPGGTAGANAAAQPAPVVHEQDGEKS